MVFDDYITELDIYLTRHDNTEDVFPDISVHPLFAS